LIKLQITRQILEATRLIKVRYFTLKELRWFFLSIIVISSLFTISSSFILGFSTQEVFVGESLEENILVISEPNVITPSQSHIPLNWASDIRELNGIESVSPETVDIVVDQTHQKPVFFRGITQEYSVNGLKTHLIT
jgi:hypothetical protein